MPRKRCSHCGQAKSLTAFYRDRATRDGFAYCCKTCSYKFSRRYYSSPQGKAKKQIQDRRYAATKHGKAAILRKTVRYQRKYADKLAAHNAVSKAVTSGKLVKKPCKVCGSTRQIEAHHNDYRKKLQVVWLCNKHHRELHERT